MSFFYDHADNFFLTFREAKISFIQLLRDVNYC